MGRRPCCSKEGLNRGAWTADEDKILRDYIRVHGEGRWRNLPKKAGLKRCGKSCRLRWLNYLRPDIKRGSISPDEQELIIRLHKLLGNRWSLIAGRLPGRTDNEIKNYWNTKLGKIVKDQSQTNGSSLRLSVPPPHSSENKTHTDTGSPSLSKLKLHSQVVRTKATKCSKVFLDASPLPHHHHSSMQLQNKPQVETHQHQHQHQPLLLLDSANNSITTSNQTEPIMNQYHNGILYFPTGEQLSSDLLPLSGFNTGELCLSDLLNSELPDMCDFSYTTSNNNTQHLSLSSLQPMLCSDQFPKDWTQTTFAETDVPNNSQFFASFLESSEEWLGQM